MRLEKPVLNLHAGKIHKGQLDRPASQFSAHNNATHDSEMSQGGGDTKSQNRSGMADSGTNQELNDFLKLAREANN